MVNQYPNAKMFHPLHRLCGNAVSRGHVIKSKININ